MKMTYTKYKTVPVLFLEEFHFFLVTPSRESFFLQRRLTSAFKCQVFVYIQHHVVRIYAARCALCIFVYFRSFHFRFIFHLSSTLCVLQNPKEGTLQWTNRGV